ncbi:MAG: hypothetical protein U0234_11405 [Sandaracinus sp.]
MANEGRIGWMIVAALVGGLAGCGTSASEATTAAPERETPAAATRPVEHAEPSVALTTVTAPTTPSRTSTLVAPAPSPSPSPRTSELRVRRMQVTSGIEGREPVDHPSSFGPDDGRVYAFVELSNPGDSPRELVVSFEHGTRATGLVTLEVPAHMPRYRTWAWTEGVHHAPHGDAPETWTAVIRDEAGDEIATDTFTVEAR